MKDKPKFNTPMIILMGWTDNGLTYIKSFKYPKEESEAQRMFNVLSESGVNCQQMTKEFFFDEYLKCKLKDHTEDITNMHNRGQI